MNLLGRALLAGFSVAVSAGGLVRSRRRSARRGTSPELLDEAFVVGDGTRLPVQVWQPTREPIGTMVALHGFADWRRSFDVSAPLFAARGMLVYAYDQRGFGQTGTRGQWAGIEALSADLREVVAVLAERHPELPLVILGESMGASLALVAAARSDPPLADALLLAAPGVHAEGSRHDIAFRLAGIALPWLRAELQRGGQPWLLPEEARRFGNDPKLLGEVSAEAYEGLVEVARQAGEVNRAKLPPTLVLHGALDTTVPEEAIGRLMSRLQPPASLLSYPTRHHLLLHEEDVDRVVDDCMAWLEPLLPAARDLRRKKRTPAAARLAEPGARVAPQTAEQPSQPRQVVKAAE